MRFVTTAALLALSAMVARAQLSYDGTLSSGVLSGPDFQLLEAHGTRSGSNLFHSFSEFNLAPGESATFSGSAGITNILGRVTGGNLSRIDGTLRSTIPGAHLFLMNPNGILFGSGSSLDVRGSFTATTADYIELADGVRFNAAPGVSDALLSSAAPAAFGFLSANPAAVEFDQSNLSVDPGQSFNVVAGDIILNQSTISARAGIVNLEGRGTSGAVTLTDSFIDVSDDGVNGAGSVVIRGGQLTLDNSRIESQNLTANNAGAIDIEVTRAVEVTNGGGLSSFNIGAGKGADITIRAAEMTVDGSATAGFTDLFTANFSSGEPGVIDLVIGGALRFVDGGALLASTLGEGTGGAINVSAGSLSIDGQSTGRLTGIRADTRNLGAGGDVMAQVAGALSIANNGVLSTDTRSTGAGGDLTIRAGSTMLDGGASVGDGFFTGITALASEGEGGTIDLNTGALDIQRGARIDASTTGSGSGGQVNVAAGRIDISGGTSAERTGIVTFSNEGLTGATGRAGDIEVQSRGDIVIRDGGLIDSSTFGRGDGGSVTVDGGDILIDRAGNDLFTGIGSDTELASGGGRGGSVSISSRSLDIRNGGLVSTGTFGSGQAGDVNVRTGSLRLDGEGAVNDTVVTGRSGIVANTTGSGDAGSVAVDAATIAMSRRAEIGSASTGQGDAGSVHVGARGDIDLDSGSRISVASAETNAGSLSVRAGGDINLDRSSITAIAAGNGGDIDITGGEYIRLFGSQIVAEAGNDGGNVNIGGARYAILDDSLISANAVNGTGGAIQVSTDVLLTNNSPITASSQFGADGTVRIDAIFDLSGSLAELDEELLDASAQLQPRCSVRLPGATGSFIMVGRGGQPLAPGQYLPGAPLMELP